MFVRAAMAEDGEVLDSWEDQEDQGILDKRLDEIKVKAAPKTATASAMGVREDTARTEYQPQVRILKRNPVTDKPNPQAANSNAAAKPVKTLEQREAEYAQARLRIFGSLEEPQNDEEGKENGEEDQSNDNRPVTVIQKFIASPSHNAVSRQPKGPDGSRGFNLER